jgi:hypothetical protein
VPFSNGSEIHPVLIDCTSPRASSAPPQLAAFPPKPTLLSQRADVVGGGWGGRHPFPGNRFVAYRKTSRTTNSESNDDHYASGSAESFEHFLPVMGLQGFFIS